MRRPQAKFQRLASFIVARADRRLPRDIRGVRKQRNRAKRNKKFVRKIFDAFACGSNVRTFPSARFAGVLHYAYGNSACLSYAKNQIHLAGGGSAFYQQRA